MQAAVLLAKLTVFPEELAARERIARVYDQRLGNAVTIPARVPDSTSAWAIYAILLPDGRARDRVQARAASGTACRPRSTTRARCIGSPPIATTHDGAPLPVSEDLAHRILALPIHPDLTEADVERICTVGACRGGVAGADGPAPTPRPRRHGPRRRGHPRCPSARRQAQP